MNEHHTHQVKMIIDGKSGYSGRVAISEQTRECTTNSWPETVESNNDKIENNELSS